MDIATKVGATQPGNGNTSNANLFSDLFGALKVSESGLRFYELNRLGVLFSISAPDTALASLNATATGLTATAKPIIGVFNPIGSGVDLVLLRAYLAITTIANSAVNPTGFQYVGGSISNNPITTGTRGNAINRKSLLASGSNAITLVNVALTGLVGNALILGPVGVTPVLNAAGNATAVSFPQGNATDPIEGAYVVKQGQFFGIMSTASTTTLDTQSELIWAELPTVV